MDNAVPIVIDGTVVGALLFERGRLCQTKPEEIFLQRVRQAIGLGAVGATLVALLIGVLLARTITRPIHELTDATHRVAEGELGHQVRAGGKDEIGELGRSFNRMSSDLARSTQLRRQMTADIAHDLRTPLSVILGYTEALSEGKLARFRADVRRDPRRGATIATSDRRPAHALAGRCRRAFAEFATDAPADMLERAAAAHQVHAQEQGVSLVTDVGDDLPRVQVDPERMAQVLGNLISNALRYTPEGGRSN